VYNGMYPQESLITKQRSVVSLNPIGEALARYAELMPGVVDVRGETVYFDLGSYAHLTRKAERGRYIGWIRETLENPQEIRQDFDHRYSFRELYINSLCEDPNDLGRPFIVIVERRIDLYFWTAFVPDDGYLKKALKGRLIWRA